jgi:cation:H+ antiporter
MSWLLAALGLVILLLAGDALVKGAVNLSLRIGIPAVIVSLTIVAFGTSAPELLIAISAVDDHAPGIALGNVVGSNTANILLVLGVPALLSPLYTSQCDTKKNYIFMIGGSLLFIALAMTGTFTWIHGLVLLAALSLVLFDSARDARNHRRDTAARLAEDPGEEVEGADPEMSGVMIAFYLTLGLIGLPLGADILVDSAVEIARTFHVSETVIGLTLVAIGTSLPELATTVMASLRRQAEVALGNVIGSNMFNLLAIIGIASFVGPIPVDRSFLTFDLWVMLGASALLAPFVFLRWDLNRLWGFLFLALYVLYLASIVI